MHTITWAWEQLNGKSCFGSSVCGPLISSLKPGGNSGIHSGVAIASAGAQWLLSCWWHWFFWLLVSGLVGLLQHWCCLLGSALSYITWSDSACLLQQIWCPQLVRDNWPLVIVFASTVHELWLHCTCGSLGTLGWIWSWQLGICGRRERWGSCGWCFSAPWACGEEVDWWGL